MKTLISRTCPWILSLVSALAWGTCVQALGEGQRFSSPTNGPSPVSLSAPSLPERPLTPWAAEIVKLAEAGIDDSVMIAFVDNTEGTFNLESGHIVGLKEGGVSGQVLAAMLQHDADVASGLRTLVPSTMPPSKPAIRFVVVTTATSDGKNPTAAGSDVNPGRTGGAEPLPEPASAEPERGVAEEWPAGDVAQPEHFGAVAEAGTVRYPVREPYPVEVAPPILVYKGAWKTPNLLVIQYSP
jgi:hypothetical protein